MIYIKIHETDNGMILAMCDKSLVGTIVDDGRIHIDLKDYSEFYTGELINSGELPERIDFEGIMSANVVGNESVDAAIANRLIKEENVHTANKIRYANAFRVKYPK